MRPEFAKYKIGQIVAYNDDFSHNPCNKVIGYGKIGAIYEFHGVKLIQKPKKSNSLKGRVKYQVQGSSLILNESDILGVCDENP